MTRVLMIAFYSLFGALFFAVGASVVLLQTGWLPATLAEGIRNFAREDVQLLHILQELGCLLVLVGLLLFWFVGHYDQSQAFHWLFTGFWGLIAFVHWVDVRGPVTSVAGPLVTTIPFLLFGALGLLRLATTEGRRSAPRKEVPLLVDSK